MDKTKVHLVPSIVLDCGEQALDMKKNDYQRDIYYARVQATALYCQEVIALYEKRFNKKVG